MTLLHNEFLDKNLLHRRYGRVAQAHALSTSAPAPDIPMPSSMKKLTDVLRLEDIDENVLEEVVNEHLSDDDLSSETDAAQGNEEDEEENGDEVVTIIPMDERNLARDFNINYRFDKAEAVRVPAGETPTGPPELSRPLQQAAPLPSIGVTAEVSKEWKGKDVLSTTAGSLSVDDPHSVASSMNNTVFVASPILSCALEQTRLTGGVTANINCDMMLTLPDSATEFLQLEIDPATSDLQNLVEDLALDDL
eukprot:Selendium_serpulae@DN5686_c0_g1_i7.p1